MKIMTRSSFGPSHLKPICLPQYLQVQNSTIKPYHGFWHREVRYNIDPEILVVDISSQLQFSCQWIDLSHLAYKPGYFIETTVIAWPSINENCFLSAMTELSFLERKPLCFGSNWYTFLQLTTKPSIFHGIASFRVIKFHIYCTTKWL